MAAHNDDRRCRARRASVLAVSLLAGLVPSIAATVPRSTPAAAAGSYSSTVLGDHPVAYWRLDEASGPSAADAAGNGNTGTYTTGGVTYGQPGALASDTDTSVALDGSTGYVQASDSTSLDQPRTAITLEAWIKPTQGANFYQKPLVLKSYTSHVAPYYQYGLTIADGESGTSRSVALYLSIGGQLVGAGGNNAWSYGVWSHLVGTFDGTTMRVYVNGSLQFTKAVTGTIDSYATPLLLGAYANLSKNSTYLYGGGLDEVAVYPTALTPSQVANHYLASSNVVAPRGPAITAAEVSAEGNFCWTCYAKRTVHGSRADPVNTATGGFFESSADLSIPGRGLPIGFTRTYSSVRAATNGPLGFGWTNSYAMSLSQNPTTGAATITGPDGSQTVFTLSGTTYSGPPRAQATLVKNGDGTFTFTQGLRVTYTFNASGQLTQEKDLNGYATGLAYNGSGQLSTITDPAQRTLTLAYTGSNLTGLTDPMGRKVGFAYNDGAGNLTDVTDVNGGKTHYTYDPNHLLLTATDPRTNVVTTNVYDSSNRVTSQTDGLQRKTTFAYSGTPLSAAGGSTTTTDPRGNVTVDQYVNGERTAITRGSGTPQAATWQYRYDPGSLGPSLVVDPNGNATSSTYDGNGNRTQVADPLGRVTTSTYDSLNDLTGTTDPKGVTTTLSYDTKGNLLTTSTPLVGSNPAQNQVTTYTYGDAAHPGDVTAVTDPDGKQAQKTYDTNGNLASATDPAGDQTTMTYNTVGWPLTTVSPRGNATGGTPSQFTTTYSYADPSTGAVNQFGDVRVITDPLGNRTVKGYDADRNVVSVQDPDGNLTQSTFDLANQQTDVIRADGTKLHTDYYPDGSVQDQVNGAGNKTGYAYDPLGHLTSVTDPLLNATAYATDPVGNVLSKTDPGGSCTATPKVGCTTSAYDAANELTGITYSDGTTPNVTGVTYDADGQRTAMTDGTGTSAWAWDSLHRMTGYTNGNGVTVQFGYNLRGLETSITYPGSHTVTQGFDDAGRMTSMQDWLSNMTTFGYDADANLTSETLPTSGAVDSFTFDRADRLMSISDANGSATVFSAVYSRDANGQVTQDTSATTTQSSYHYTALNQVCYAALHTVAACTSPPPKSQPFSYDAADNLTLIGATQQAFNADGELCWTASTAGACGSPPTGATTYTYDTRGNRTQVAPSGTGATTLGYDQANRLTSNGTAATYSYNGDGLRMSKTASGSTTQYLWNASASLPLLLQDGTTSYVYGPGGLPLEQVAGSTVLYYHQDQLGSTRLLTTSSGASAATYTFDPYGNLTASTGSATTPFRFGGQYQDTSGLYYLRARYYDPATAQFLSRDALASLTKQPYAYVGGNPLNGTDPSGMLCTKPGPNHTCLQSNDCAYATCPSFHDPNCPSDMSNVSCTGGAGQVGGGQPFDNSGPSIYDWAWDNKFDIALTALPLGRIAAACRDAIDFVRFGGEIKAGDDLRIAPFGNRGPGRFELPHYHRRVVDPATGQTVPGQGIGRHRPWESKGTDTSFWDRF